MTRETLPTPLDKEERGGLEKPASPPLLPRHGARTVNRTTMPAACPKEHSEAKGEKAPRAQGLSGGLAAGGAEPL